MKRRAVLIAAASAVGFNPFGFGQASPLDFERVAPKAPLLFPTARILPPAETAEVPDDSLVLQNLKGIVLLDDPAKLRPAGRTGIAGVVTEGDGLLSDQRLAARLKPFITKPITFGDLQKISTDIVRFFRENNRPVVDAQLPEQDITNGTLQVVVIQGRTGRIVAEDQRWFPEQRLVRGISATRGDPIDSSLLLDDINWLNRNPFRRTDLIFRKGEVPGETDLVLKTTDRFPFRPYVAYDNWGTDLTDNHRLQAGFNWGNAFGPDHQLSYQFTSAPDPSVFTAHAWIYSVPLPWRHVLEFYGSTAQSKPDGLDIDVDAKSLQLGLLYTVPLHNFHGIKHDLSLGIEFKQSNNDLLFGGTNIFASDTDIAQVRLSYQARQTDSHGVTTLQASAYYSPGGITSNNTDEAFEQERAFAHADYGYGRLTLQRTQTLPWRLSVVGTISGQIASGNLLASEQFSLGGATTIRGYQEGIVNGDGGWFGSVELYSPPIPLLNRIRTGFVDEELKFVAFCDFGGVSSVDLLPGERSYVGVAGVGVGVRYRLNTWLSVRFDYAWKLKEVSGLDTDDSRAYVSVTASY